MIQKTERGYEQDRVRQILVFMQNRLGELSDVLRFLRKAEITVHALSVSDSVDYAVVRMIVDDTDTALRVLKERDLPTRATPVLAVQLEENEQKSLLDMTRALLSGEINTHYLYPMFTQPRGLPVVVVNMDDLDFSAEVLTKRGFYLLDEGDLFEMDDPLQ